MAGSGGVANGCMIGWVCLTTTSSVDGQVRKSPQYDRPHNSWHEANRCAQCGKSARWVRCGGGWKRVHGSANEALPEEPGATARLDLRNTAPVLDPTGIATGIRRLALISGSAS